MGDEEEGFIITGGDDRRLSFLNADGSPKYPSLPVPEKSRAVIVTVTPEERTISKSLDPAHSSSTKGLCYTRVSPSLAQIVSGDSIDLTATGPDEDDNGLIAISSQDHTISLWGAPSATRLAHLRGHSSAVYDVTFAGFGSLSGPSSSSPTLLFSGSYDNTVRVWDLSTTACVRTFTQHSADVEALAGIPALRLVASGADDGDVRLWDARSTRRGTQAVGTCACGSQVYALCCRRTHGLGDTRPQLLVGTRDGVIRLLDLRMLTTTTTSRAERAVPCVWTLPAHAAGDIWEISDCGPELGCFYSASWGDEKTKAWDWGQVDAAGESGGGDAVERMISVSEKWAFSTGPDMTSAVPFFPNFEERGLGWCGGFGPIAEFGIGATGAGEGFSRDVGTATERIQFLLESKLSTAATILATFSGGAMSLAEAEDHISALTKWGIDVEEMLLALFGCSECVSVSHPSRWLNLCRFFTSIPQQKKMAYCCCRHLRTLPLPSLVCVARTALSEHRERIAQNRSEASGVSDTDLLRMELPTRGEDGLPIESDPQPSADDEEMSPMLVTLIRELRRRRGQVQKNATLMRALSQCGCLQYLFGSFIEESETPLESYFREAADGEPAETFPVSFGELAESRCQEMFRTRAAANVTLHTADGGEEKAHLEILLWRSEFFYRMLHFGGKETQEVISEKRLSIHGLSGAELKALLTLHYNGDLPAEVSGVDFPAMLRLLSHLSMHFEVRPAIRLRTKLARMVAAMEPSQLTLEILQSGHLIQELAEDAREWATKCISKRLSSPAVSSAHLKTLIRCSEAMKMQAQQLEKDEADGKEKTDSCDDEMDVQASSKRRFGQLSSFVEADRKEKSSRKKLFENFAQPPLNPPDLGSFPVSIMNGRCHHQYTNLPTELLKKKGPTCLFDGCDAPLAADSLFFVVPFATIRDKVERKPASSRADEGGKKEKTGTMCCVM